MCSDKEKCTSNKEKKCVNCVETILNAHGIKMKI